MQPTERKNGESKHILAVFERVLSRDKNRTIKSEEEHGNPFLMVTIPSGEKFRVVCYLTRSHLNVVCHVENDAGVRTSFYEFRCDRNKLPKIRKVALVLSKKISFYDLHQVMDS